MVFTPRLYRLCADWQRLTGDLRLMGRDYLVTLVWYVIPRGGWKACSSTSAKHTYSWRTSNYHDTNATSIYIFYGSVKFANGDAPGTFGTQRDDDWSATSAYSRSARSPIPRGARSATLKVILLFLEFVREPMPRSFGAHRFTANKHARGTNEQQQYYRWM